MAEAADATGRLRRLVLDLAVRGKVTDRNPTDEPASQLLLEIEHKMIESSQPGAGRRAAPIAPFGPEEVPFVVPKGWLWTRIRQVTQDRGQTTPSSDFTYIDVSAIDKKAGRIGVPVVLAASNAPSRARKVVMFGDVVYSCVRPYLLNVAVVDIHFEPPPIASTAFVVLDGLGLVLPRYLWIVLRSSYFVECVEEKMRGQAYPAINDADFALLPVPLPPFAEQHRIVAKVDELVGLCDQLEAAHKEREVRRDRLRAATLGRLTSSYNNGAPSVANVRFFLDRSPRLITKAEHVAALRRTVLDLAVRGRLVPQDPRDQPAQELLGTRATSLDPDRAPWPLPVGWAWSCLAKLGKQMSGGTPSKSNADYWIGSIPWVSPKDMKVDLILDARDHVSADAVASSATRLVPVPALLMVVRGMILAHSFPTALSGVPLTMNQDMKALIPFRADLAPMLLLLTKGMKPHVMALVQHSTHGTCRLNTDELLGLTLPIPPLAEQHRIVAKVDEMMAICAELEATLASAQDRKGRLLEALLDEALEGARPPYAKV
jgi:type I restriction enzyme S subunit